MRYVIKGCLYAYGGDAGCPGLGATDLRSLFLRQDLGLKGRDLA
jgi:hypothetical protein